MNCTCREQTLELLAKMSENMPAPSPSRLFLDSFGMALRSLPPCQCGETIGKAVVNYAELQMKASQWFQHSEELTSLKRLYDEAKQTNLEYIAFKQWHNKCDEDRRVYAQTLSSIRAKVAAMHIALDDLI